MSFSISFKLATLKSPSTVCLSADAATAKFIASSPLFPEESAKMSPAPKLSPPPTLSTISKRYFFETEVKLSPQSNADQLFTLAERLSAASGYALETVPAESANAGYKDYVIDSLDVPAFTVECGRGENPLPEEQLGGISAAVEAVCGELALWCAAT